MSLIRIDRTEIEKMGRIERLNLINSCTGYKSANLIATINNEGQTNVAVFSSVTHLGSDPALISFILRPTTVPRHTYQNIKEYGYFSVNHITSKQIADAHHTSANYPQEISEFDMTDLEAVYHGGCPVPFVKGSPVKLLCKYVNEYLIEENGCSTKKNSEPQTTGYSSIKDMLSPSMGSTVTPNRNFWNDFRTQDQKNKA
jgi:flavin reductase (DIM6/NTAB) family NADH-FMN oxidoreductase RutF